MSGPVERWLETFMCKQYADTFETFGFKTLQSVCQLQLPQLQRMGVAPEHCESILENVHVLRQTLLGRTETRNSDDSVAPPTSMYDPAVTPASNALRSVALNANMNRGGGNPYSENMGSNYDPSMAGQGRGHPMMGMAYHGRENPTGGGMPVNMMGYGSHPSGNYGNAGNPAMMMSQQGQPYSSQNIYPAHSQAQQFYNSGYRHPYSGGSFPSQGQPHMSDHAGGFTNPHVGMGSNSGGNNGSYNQRRPMPNPGQGQSHGQGLGHSQNQSHGQGQGNTQSQGHVQNQGHGQGPGGGGGGMMQHHHVKRNPSQTPQEVANNILQMASSTYPSHQTVQVPLSKHRSAPYHIPPRSPHHMSGGGQQQMQQHQQTGQEICQLQHQQQQQHGMMQSNRQFVYPNTSPHGPPHNRMSPISPAQGIMPSPHSHHSGQSLPNSSPGSLHSPGPGGMRSPMSDSGLATLRSPSCAMQQMTGGQPMRSPVPVNQPLQVAVPSNPSSHSSVQNYNEDMTSPAHSHHHLSHYSPSTNTITSPTGHFSNISSPYTPGSKASIHSPPQTQSYSHPPSASQYLTEASLAQDSLDQGGPDKKGTVNPLWSLQRLCMLPEKQVIDPKSVVNDACLPSPQAQTSEAPKNCDTDADFQNTDHAEAGSSAESASSNSNTKCSDGKHCGPESEAPSSTQVSVIQSNKLDNSGRESSHSNISSTVGEHDKTNSETQKTSTVDDCVNKNVSDSSSSNISGTLLKNDNILDTSDIGNSNQQKNSPPKNKGSEKKKTKVNVKSKMVVAGDNVLNGDLDEVKFQPKKKILLRATQTEVSEGSEKTSALDKSSGEHCDTQNSDTAVNSALCNSETPSTDLNSEQSDQLDPKSGPLADESHKESADNSDINGATPQKLLPGGKDLEKVDKTDWSPPSPSSLVIEKDTNIASAGNGILSDLSDTDEEASRLIVRKDIRTTYSKQDRFTSPFKSTGDIPGRVRNQSTGSLSDLDNSDFGFEDHIGCDDLDNNVSDIELGVEKPDVVNSTVMARIDVSSKVKLSTSPHWKKSKINNLQAIQGDEKQDDGHVKSGKADKKIKAVVMTNGSSCPRKVRTRQSISLVRNSLCSVSGDESDGIIPSPGTGDMGVDYVTVDNNDGTVGISKRVNGRKRKAPRKYEDNSFFKGDFIFDEEEEDEDYVPEPKKKGKKILFADCPFDAHNRDGMIPNGKLENSASPKCEQNSLGKKDFAQKRVDNKKKDSTPKRKKHSSSTKNAEQKPASYKNRTNVCESECDAGSGSSPVLNSNKMELNLLKQDDKVPSLGNQKSSAGCESGLVPSPKEEKAKVKEEVEFVDLASEDSVQTVDLTRNNENDSTVVEKNETSKCRVMTDSKCSDEHDGKIGSSTPNTAGKSQTKMKKKPVSLKVNVKSGANNKKKRGRPKKGIDCDSDYEIGPGKNLKNLKLNKTHKLMASKKKPKNLDTSGASVKFKGPVIRLHGSKTSPDSYTLINQPLEDCDPKSKKPKTSTAQSVSTSIQISHMPSDKSLFVPSTQQDSDKWGCALCGKHSSYKFLGDLFGPYSLDVPMDEKRLSSPESASKKLSFKRSRKSSSEEKGASCSSRSVRPPRRGSGDFRRSQSKDSCQDSGPWREVWVHEDCVVWSDGVFLIGAKIYGLQEAARIANQTVCTHCRENGAMVGCLHKGCTQKFHYACALERDCYLDEENFCLLCPRHKVKKLRQPESSTSAVS